MKPVRQTALLIAAIAAVQLSACQPGTDRTPDLTIDLPDPAEPPVPEAGCDDPLLVADHQGSLYIRYEEDYRAMRCFVRVDGDVYLYAPWLERISLPRLEEITGNLIVFDMIRLTQFSAPQLAVVGKTLSLSGSVALRSLALPALRSAGEGLVLDDNGLAEVSFPVLTRIGRNYEELYGLRVHRNPDLHDLSGFSALTELDGLIFLTRTAILNLDGLSRLTRIDGGLVFEDNPYLDNIDGIAAAAADGPIITLTDNPALRSIAGLSAMRTTFNAIIIVNSPRLESLAGLENLEQMQGNLWIERTGIHDVDALASLRSIGIDFYMVDSGLDLLRNPNLSNLDGLSQLQTIDGMLIVESNPGISNCAVHALAEQLASPPLFTAINGNGSKNDCDF